ncbi:hypothetical protein [Duganella sp. FT27W]|uniref:hypothetical protein n=1 Tax=Duganella sp. FT27W TaxID=2654636 RepID=UPI00128E0B82|nr:hypothetical protein [Duganella sp. FT27W]MPQ57478.1 hypothetical protein [Duganella sp. FT27W]
MAKMAFSRSDVIAINRRMVAKPASQQEARNGPVFPTLSRSPSSPIAAKLMREVGVSSKKMSEAYRFARSAVIKAE